MRIEQPTLNVFFDKQFVKHFTNIGGRLLYESDPIAPGHPVYKKEYLGINFWGRVKYTMSGGDKVYTDWISSQRFFIINNHGKFIFL